MASIPRLRVRPLGSPRKSGVRTTTNRSYAGGVLVSTGTPSVANGTATLVGQEKNYDHVTVSPPRADHDLTITKRKASGGTISGRYYAPEKPPNIGTQSEVVYTDFGSSHFGNPWSSGNPTLSNPDWAYWHTTAVSQMVVHQPVVDAWSFLWELREFPRMLRDLGRVLSKQVKPEDVPGGYLAYKFGWAPLIADALSLIDFQSEVNRRVRTIIEARSGGQRFRRNLLRQKSLVKVGSSILASTSSPSRSLVIGEYKETNIECWFTSRMVIKDPSPELDRLLELLRSPELTPLLALTGLTSGPTAASIWEVIPWSWLIDYFVDVSSFIDAYANSIPYEFKDMNIMWHEKLLVTGKVDSNTFSGLHWKKSEFLLEQKLRSVRYLSPVIPSAQPFLTASHSAILVALFTARTLKGITFKL